jgi:hypothetical protein
VCDPLSGTLNWLPAQIASTGAVTKTAAGFTDRVASGSTQFDGSTGFGTVEGCVLWVTGAAGSFLDIGFPLATFDDTYAFPVAPGKQFTIGFWLKADASFSSKLFLNFCNAAGTDVGNVSTTMTVTTTFVRYSVTGTAPATAVWARAGLENTANVQGRSVWLSLGQLTDAATVGTWVPGQGDGRQWTTLRVANLLDLLVNPDQEHTVYDYELPRGMPRFYRARAIKDVAGQPVGSANYVYGVGQIQNDGQWWIIDPYHPWQNAALAPTELAQTVEESAQAHLPLGRDRPVVLADQLYGEDGTVSYWTKTAEDLLRMRNLLRCQHTMLLRSPFDDEQWYVRFTERARSYETPYPTVLRAHQLKYYEVEAPT